MLYLCQKGHINQKREEDLESLDIGRGRALQVADVSSNTEEPKVERN